MLVNPFREGVFRSVDRGQEMFGGMLTSIGQEKAFGGFWRRVVETHKIPQRSQESQMPSQMLTVADSNLTLPHLVTGFQP